MLKHLSTTLSVEKTFENFSRKVIVFFSNNPSIEKPIGILQHFIAKVFFSESSRFFCCHKKPMVRNIRSSRDEIGTITIQFEVLKSSFSRIYIP